MKHVKRASQKRRRSYDSEVQMMIPEKFVKAAFHKLIKQIYKAQLIVLKKIHDIEIKIDKLNVKLNAVYDCVKTPGRTNDKNDIQSSIPQEEKVMDEVLARAEIFSLQNKVELLRKAASEKPPNNTETNKGKGPADQSQKPYQQIPENVMTVAVPEVPRRQPETPTPYQQIPVNVTTFAVPEVPGRQPETPTRAAKLRYRRASVALGEPGQATASFYPRLPVPATPHLPPPVGTQHAYTPPAFMNAPSQPAPFNLMAQAMAQQQPYGEQEYNTPPLYQQTPQNQTIFVAPEVPTRQTQTSTRAAKLRDRRASVTMAAPGQATANYYPRPPVPATPQPPPAFMRAASQPAPVPFDFMSQAMAQQKAYEEQEYNENQLRKRMRMDGQFQFQQTPRNFGNMFGNYYTNNAAVPGPPNLYPDN